MSKEEIIKQYYKDRDLECPDLYCKDCGKLLIYDGSDIKFARRDGAKVKKGDINNYGITFLTTRDYNGHTYRLCRCKECVAKLYPAINEAKFAYSAKFAKYTQYAFDVSDDDFSAYTKSRQSLTKEKMVAKYGDKEGLNKWESYCKKQSETNTFEYKAKKYGMTIEEFGEYNKSRACTKDLFIQRHGEVEGLKKWDEYCERQRYTTQPEYFIEKYGEDEGKKRFQSFLNKRIDIRGYSKSANLFFEELIKRNEFKDHICYYYNHPHEYTVGKYNVDFYDKTTNVVIEFYGNVWHANPKIYKETDIIHFLGKTIIVSDKWKNDKLRQQYIEDKLKCIFIVVWESDVKNKSNRLETINNICNIINKNN